MRQKHVTHEHPHALMPQLPDEGRAAVRGGVVGNYVDQIHIFLPVTALGPALPHLAGRDAIAATTAFVVMATLIGRPAGAMIFGRIADRFGRTSTTKVAIAGTAACTLGIAAVPTYEVLGIWTMVLVIALRFLGGVFLAGEYSAAIPLAMEWSKPRQRGGISGAIMSMAPWAQATIAFVSAMLLSSLGATSYGIWGWRLIFLAGGLASLAMLVYYIRRVGDARHVVKPTTRTLAAKVGLREVLIGRYRRSFWQMFGLMSGLWFMTNMVVIVLTGRLSVDNGLTPQQASIAMGVAAVGQAMGMVFAGQLSTLTGRRRFFTIWGLIATVSGPLLWLWISTQRGLLPIALGAIALQVLTVCAYGPIGAYLTERYPAHVRSTGYGTAYSLSIVIPALYPYYLPTLEGLLGRVGAPMALLLLGGLLVTGCARLGPALTPEEIDDDVESVAARQNVGDEHLLAELGEQPGPDAAAPDTSAPDTPAPDAPTQKAPTPQAPAPETPVRHRPSERP